MATARDPCGVSPAPPPQRSGSPRRSGRTGVGRLQFFLTPFLHAHAQVADTVTIKVTQRGHRDAEPIFIIKDAVEAAIGVADFLV